MMIGMLGEQVPNLRALVGDPPTCGPDDRVTARQMVERLDGAIRRGGWSLSEKNRLYNRRAKWRRRAVGQDLQYRLRGTTGGRIPAKMLATPS